jgi:hypothetical protein
MPEIGTSGLMSGDGKRDGFTSEHPRPSSTLPVKPRSQSSAKAKRRLESRRGTQECVRYTLFANISCFLQKCNLLSYDIALGKVLGVHSMLEEAMAETDKSPDILVQECLKSLEISLLGDWDVLVFLYRHRASLASAEQLARLLGYPSKAVGDALDRLESQRLIQRSRSSQGVRFYQFLFSEANLAPESCFRRLMSLAENRTGRLLLVNNLRQRVGLHIGAKGKTK